MRIIVALFVSAAIMGCSSKQEVIENYPGGKPKIVITRQSRFLLPDSKPHRLEYYRNGNRKSDGAWRNNLYHGPFRSWWLNGKKQSQGRYIDGRRYGEWRFFFDQSGGLSSVGAFENGKREGVWTFWGMDGERRRVTMFHSGSPGEFTYTWHANGVMETSNTCLPGSDTGSYQTWYPGGELREHHACRQGRPFGPGESWFRDGSVAGRGDYDSLGRPSGLWQTLHPGGRVAERRFFTAGLDNGPRQVFDPRGTLRAEGFFIHGTGVLKRYFPNRTIAGLEPMFTGKRQGVHRSFYASGRKESETLYVNDTARSLTRWYDAERDGRQPLAMFGAFFAGNRHGHWNFFFANGKPREMARYVRGELEGPSILFDSASGRPQLVKYYHRGVLSRTDMAGRSGFRPPSS